MKRIIAPALLIIAAVPGCATAPNQVSFAQDFLGGFRHGAQALAGAMSPAVFQEQSNERARVQEARRDRQAKVAEIMLRAAHSGQIPEEKLPEIQQALARMGYELPIEALPATPDARGNLGEYARLKSDRSSVR